MRSALALGRDQLGPEYFDLAKLDAELVTPIGEDNIERPPSILAVGKQAFGNVYHFATLEGDTGAVVKTDKAEMAGLTRIGDQGYMVTVSDADVASKRHVNLYTIDGQGETTRIQFDETNSISRGATILDYAAYSHDDVIYFDVIFQKHGENKPLEMTSLVFSQYSDPIGQLPSGHFMSTEQIRVTSEPIRDAKIVHAGGDTAAIEVAFLDADNPATKVFLAVRASNPEFDESTQSMRDSEPRLRIIEWQNLACISVGTEKSLSLAGAGFSPPDARGETDIIRVACVESISPQQVEISYFMGELKERRGAGPQDIKWQENDRQSIRTKQPSTLQGQTPLTAGAQHLWGELVLGVAESPPTLVDHTSGRPYWQITRSVGLTYVGMATVGQHNDALVKFDTSFFKQYFVYHNPDSPHNPSIRDEQTITPTGPTTLKITEFDAAKPVKFVLAPLPGFRPTISYQYHGADSVETQRLHVTAVLSAIPHVGGINWNVDSTDPTTFGRSNSTAKSSAETMDFSLSASAGFEAEAAGFGASVMHTVTARAGMRSSTEEVIQQGQNFRGEAFEHNLAGLRQSYKVDRYTILESSFGGAGGSFAVETPVRAPVMEVIPLSVYNKHYQGGLDVSRATQSAVPGDLRTYPGTTDMTRRCTDTILTSPTLGASLGKTTAGSSFQISLANSEATEFSWGVSLAREASASAFGLKVGHGFSAGYGQESEIRFSRETVFSGGAGAVPVTADGRYNNERFDWAAVACRMALPSSDGSLHYVWYVGYGVDNYRGNGPYNQDNANKETLAQHLGEPRVKIVEENDRLEWPDFTDQSYTVEVDHLDDSGTRKISWGTNSLPVSKLELEPEQKVRWRAYQGKDPIDGRATDWQFVRLAAKLHAPNFAKAPVLDTDGNLHLFIRGDLARMSEIGYKIEKTTSSGGRADAVPPRSVEPATHIVIENDAGQFDRLRKITVSLTGTNLDGKVSEARTDTFDVSRPTLWINGPNRAVPLGEPVEYRLPAGFIIARNADGGFHLGNHHFGEVVDSTATSLTIKGKLPRAGYMETTLEIVETDSNARPVTATMSRLWMLEPPTVTVEAPNYSFAGEPVTAKAEVHIPSFVQENKYGLWFKVGDDEDFNQRLTKDSLGRKTYEFSQTFEEAGAHEMCFAVKDRRNEEFPVVAEDCAIVMIPFDRPLGQILAPTQKVVEIDSMSPLTIEVDAFDGYGLNRTKLKFGNGDSAERWYAGPFADHYSVTYHYPTPGNYELCFEASGRLADSREDCRKIVVRNQNPKVEIREIVGQDSPTQGFEHRWEIIASDPDGTVDDIDWIADNGEKGHDGDIRVTFEDGGQHEICVTVTDQGTGSTTECITVEVLKFNSASASAESSPDQGKPEAKPIVEDDSVGDVATNQNGESSGRAANHADDDNLQAAPENGLGGMTRILIGAIAVLAIGLLIGRKMKSKKGGDQ